MAAGDIKWFASALLKLGQEGIQMDSDTLKVALITDAVTPALDTANPCWGAGGSTNLSTNEVTAGGVYSAGGALLQISSGGAGSQTWTAVSNAPTLRADPVTWAQNASNPTDARWGIIWDDTATDKACLGFVDLGSVRNLSTGALTIDWNGADNDILRITQS